MNSTAAPQARAVTAAMTKESILENQEENNQTAKQPTATHAVTESAVTSRTHDIYIFIITSDKSSTFLKYNYIYKPLAS